MKIKTIIVILLLNCLFGCNRLNFDDAWIGDRQSELPVAAISNSRLAETSAPKIIRKLSQNMQSADGSPQIKIVAPQNGRTLDRTDVAVELVADNFSVFKDDFLGLGNHINLIIDNEPFQAIYNIKEPIIVKNLTPGSHTIRAFAVRAWGESIKTKNAYTQATFNVLTETQENLPNPNHPLLTYNSPTGTYGAEPILLDFYLSDPNLQAGNSTNIEPYSVRATVNGTSFTINDWQPYYLTGFEPGENWIQLELLDSSGKVVENAFNNTVRVFNYDPQKEDAIAKLVTDRVSFNDARAIVEPSYYVRSVETPEVIVETSAEPEIIVDELESEIARNSDSQIETSEIDSSAEPAAIALVEQKSDDFDELVEDNLDKQLETNVIDTSDAELSDSINALPKTVELETVEDAVELETEESTATNEVQKIIISEPDVDANPVAEITIPQPESVEITESEIAITIPNSQPQSESEMLERSPKVALWWKKILVGIRQSIETLAKKLPSEV